jgi:hypothetical protein
VKRLALATFAAMMLLPLVSRAWHSLDDDDVWPHTTWPTVPIDYYLNQNGCADIGGFAPTQTIVLDSFATWSAPVCTLWDTYYRGTTTRMPNRDGRQVIGWQETSWPHSSSAIGVCEVYFSSSTQIAEADIRMNGEDYHWNTTGSGGIDTQSICTHEMGHFTGLGDLYGSDCSMGQTMCGTYGGGTSKRTLTSDDIDGVCTLYPTGCTVPTDCPPGFDCVSGSCVPVPSDVCAPCDYDAECGGPEDYCLFGFPDGNSYCGATCTTDIDCDWGYVCITLTGGTIRQCIPYNFSCDPPPAPECEFDTDCPERFTCRDMLCIGGLCARCEDNFDCGTGDDYCVSGFTDGLSYCGTRCVVGSDCPWGFSCVGVSAGVTQCVPNDNNCASPPAPECLTEEDCEEGFYCEFGYCFPEPECTSSEDCPEGEICVDEECIPDPNPHLPLCAECTSHSECGDHQDLCLEGFVDGLKHCGMHCETDEDCGEGLMCYHFAPELELPSQCVPPSMDCSTYCTSDDDCTVPEHCESGRCTDACDPADPLSCPDGYYCDFEGCTSGSCVELGEVGDAALGAPCSSDLDCAGLRCVEMLGGSFCSESCDFISGGACAADMQCQPLSGGACGYCSCSTGLIADPCTGNADCQGDICVSGFCTMLCPSEGCAPGFDCENIAGYDLCMPASYGVGQSCSANTDCLSGMCTRHGGRSFCTRPCGGACSCPAGMDCVDLVCITSAGDDGSQDKGCGCALVGRGGPPWPALALLTVLLALLLRRR